MRRVCESVREVSERIAKMHGRVYERVCMRGCMREGVCVRMCDRVCEGMYERVCNERVCQYLLRSNNQVPFAQRCDLHDIGEFIFGRVTVLVLRGLVRGVMERMCY